MKELLIYALEVLVCSAALLLAYSVLLERRTAFLHCRLYLIGAMLLAALIPALSIPVWTGETLYMAADPVAAAAPTAAPAATDAGTPSLPVAVTLFLYALGVLLPFGAMIAQIVRIRRLRHGARTIRRADCDIVLTQADISSFSFFRTVYLHDAIPESDMAAVVAHELSHIRHRHSAERIVMECVKALLWWNPFVRIAARRLAEVDHILSQCAGYIVVSYNDCPFIRSLYGDFYILAFRRSNTLSQRAGATYDELIMTNYDPRPYIQPQFSMFPAEIENGDLVLVHEPTCGSLREIYLRRRNEHETDKNDAPAGAGGEAGNGREMSPGSNGPNDGDGDRSAQYPPGQPPDERSSGA